MNLNRRVPNGLPGGVRGREFYYFLLLDYTKKRPATTGPHLESQESIRMVRYQMC